MPIFDGFLLDGRQLIIFSLLVVFLIKSVPIDGQAVQVFKIGKESHDVVYLVFCLEVDVETAQVWQGGDRFYTLLKVVEDYVLQVHVRDVFQARKVPW